MEDIHTHKNYAFLANRFYEALMADVVILFDAECSNTIEKCGYPIHKDTIIDSDKLKNGIVEYAKTLDFDTILQYQRLFIHKAMSEKQDTINQIKDFIK